jgi:integrase
MNGTITKYRKKDGRISWGYYYKTGTEQVTKQGFPTKDDARHALDQALGKNAVVVSGKPQADGVRGDQRTVSAYLTYWLDNHAALRCTPATMENYRGLAKYLLKHLGKVPLCDLRAGQIQDFVNHLQLRGGEKTTQHPEGRPLSPKRVHAAASLLYSVLADAVRLEHLTVNPMSDKRVKLPKRPKRRPAVIDPAMIGKLFDAARGARAYAFIVTAACTGARRGELCALTWNDVDLDKGIVTISKSLEQTRRAPLRVKSTKSGETRHFPLDEFAIETLRDHRTEQDADRAMFGSGYQDNGLVFCQPDGRFYSPNNIGLRVVELMKKAGLEGFSLHALRHSHASVLLGQGVPLPVVSARLGHRDANITLGVYSHALPADVRAASQAWRNALSEVITGGREKAAKKEKLQNLGTSRKSAVNY